MKCRQFHDLLVYLAYLDLPLEHQRRMDDHLRHCTGCAAEWHEYQEVKRLAKQLPPSPVPPDMESRLRKVIDLAPRAAAGRD
jgi:hypothetical protein